MSLTWTAAGAVAAPDTLQIRVELGFEGRVTAGAPVPSRALSDDEVRENVRRFTIARSGPRTRPVRSLVLSGLDVSARGGLAGPLEDSRAWGIQRVVVHLGRGQREALRGSPLLKSIAAVAATVADDADLADLAALSRISGLEVTAVVVLDELALGRLAHLTAGLVALAPARVVLQWPLPNGSAVVPPRAERVAATLLDAVEPLEAAGIRVTIKGLPACQVGPFSARVTRTANRWYVDADHQGDGALLFQPEVVRFVHPDECRFCSRADTCDGAPDAWWRAGVVGRLRAFA